MNLKTWVTFPMDFYFPVVVEPQKETYIFTND